ncbi:hypothetical protein FQN54_009423 [Arachnomyces sp. PD_36]|nr:hypothetical protein FQN54_009423 [Arachnomyces sp. PD_36]
MQAPHHRKIELQSPADLSYLYANTLAISRQKLDLHFPPSANNNDSNDPDPMKERVRELVDEFITKTFTSATPSLSINGLDLPTTTTSLHSLLSESSPTETIEYEPYDGRLAAKLSSLYAQLESLTTTVAQLRRDAPAKAARGYAEVLMGGLDGDEEDDGDGLGEDGEGWELSVVPELGGEGAGEMEEVYEEALRTLLRLQGEGRGGGGTATGEEGGEEDDDDDETSGTGGGGGGGGVKGLATTVGKVERAGRAAEVVEKM